jgi:hypothetical protein
MHYDFHVVCFLGTRIADFTILDRLTRAAVS